jgi:hypothetical protein
VFLQEHISVRETMQPLLLWQTGFWAALYHCYVSGKRQQLVNMLNRLALCLVMLALLPVEARRNRRARLKALAREAKRAAKNVAKDREPQHVFFTACPDSSLPPQPNIPAHEAEGGQSCPAQDIVQDSSHGMACSPLSPKPAKLQISSSGLVERKDTAILTTLAPPDDGPEPLVSTPLSNMHLTEAGPEAPTQLLPRESGAGVEAQQEGNEADDEQQGLPPAEEKGPDTLQSPRLPPGLPEQGRSGSLLHADQQKSGVSPRVLVRPPRTPCRKREDSRDSSKAPLLSGGPSMKRKAGQQAGTAQQEPTLERDETEVVPGSGDGLDCLQRTEGQVCSLMTGFSC